MRVSEPNPYSHACTLCSVTVAYESMETASRVHRTPCITLTFSKFYIQYSLSMNLCAR
jgi:hypothetical protein